MSLSNDSTVKKETYNFGNFDYLVLKKIPKNKIKNLSKLILDKSPCKLEFLLEEEDINIYLKKNSTVLILQFYNGKESGISIIRSIQQSNSYNKIFIEYLCTSLMCEKEKLRCGEHLINFIKSYWCLGKECLISLHSLNSATGFYKKMSFKRLEDSEYENEFVFKNYE